MKNPILFLDFDGVLNHYEFLKRWIKKTGDNDGIDVHSAQALQRILDQGVDVVISSTWRIYFTDEELKTKLAARGAPRVNIIGRTPNSIDGHRGHEILTWLERNDCDPELSFYVVLDDDESVGDIPALKSRWVKTDYRGTGLRSRHVPEALVILGLKEKR